MAAKQHATANNGTGRRKSSVASVRLAPGSGKITINRRDVSEYFPGAALETLVRAPLGAVGFDKQVDVFVRVNGGGVTGQAGAVALGVARALVKYDSETEAALRDNRFLTVDSRRKERKKYGQRGARRSFQFSKR